MFLYKQINGVNHNEIESDGMVWVQMCKVFVNNAVQLSSLKNSLNNLALEAQHHLLDLMSHLIVPKGGESEPVSQSESQAKAQVQNENKAKAQVLLVKSEAQSHNTLHSITQWSSR